ncbi:MAG TPA: NAD-dependent succinate-semialdehyde dehydrogenase [Gammaproteobacteria bacterium]|jgi:succinate-semialdehyde dehydrogenase/glutarate-semialdehyde dehydrogenase
MTFSSLDPATGDKLSDYPEWDATRLDKALDLGQSAFPRWAALEVGERCKYLAKVGEILLQKRDHYAGLMSREMGKITAEARAEVEKCAAACRYYADEAPRMLADELIATDAKKSLVAFEPLGLLLAIMPWNFPFWQVIRAAIPALAAGNVVVLKHADNVPGCGLALDEAFQAAGLPSGVFQTLMIGIPTIDHVIRDPRIQAVTLTGSEKAGIAVGKAAGETLKKCVLELGGSDAFVVLEDADISLSAKQGCISRFQNAGQSCIAAKRFILVEKVADAFLEAFKAEAAKLKTGDPRAEGTTLGPLARLDLRDKLHGQVQDALERGAKAVLGCQRPTGKGAFYPASILDGVRPGMRAWNEEVFGPVASVIRVKDEAEALEVANITNFGLGGSVWSQDRKRGEAFARRMQCGSAFINRMVKSDQRLPFGGVKRSGHGRELSVHGVHEFVNVKTLSLD